MAVHHRIPKLVALGLGLSLAIVAATAPRVAQAQDAYSCIEQLSDDEVKYRINKIENDLRDGKKHATRWRYTWMGLFLALGGGATYLAIDAANDNQDWDKFGYAYLAAGFYFSGIMHAAIPAPDVWGAKRIAKKDGSTPEARVAKLKYATDTLRKANGTQSLFAGPLGVVGATIFGVVGGSIKAAKWTGQTRGLTAGMFLAPPILAGLSNATAPRQAVEAWEGYRGIACSSKYYDTHTEGPELDFSLHPGGGSFTVNF
ncbi:MAG: hypothetical protein AAGF92_13780 [Myxococcota bacterium]